MEKKQNLVNGTFEFRSEQMADNNRDNNRHNNRHNNRDNNCDFTVFKIIELPSNMKIKYYINTKANFLSYIFTFFKQIMKLLIQQRADPRSSYSVRLL